MPSLIFSNVQSSNPRPRSSTPAFSSSGSSSPPSSPLSAYLTSKRTSPLLPPARGPRRERKLPLPATALPLPRLCRHLRPRRLSFLPRPASPTLLRRSLTRRFVPSLSSWPCLPLHRFAPASDRADKIFLRFCFASPNRNGSLPTC
jgi:hypothetical protein